MSCHEHLSTTIVSQRLTLFAIFLSHSQATILLLHVYTWNGQCNTFIGQLVHKEINILQFPCKILCFYSFLKIK